MAQEQGMRRAEHKLLRIGYGAGAHNKGLGCLRWTIFEMDFYKILYNKKRNPPFGG